MILAPFAAGSDTSLAAAISVQDDLERLERMVYNCIAMTGTCGITCDRIEAETGLSHQTASARVNALKRKGVILDSTRRELTRSGRPATLWIVATP
jgi:hypothetical protein